MIILNLLVTTTCICAAYAATDDPGPQTFRPTTPKTLPSTQRPRYVMKDAILYLTPSQIKTLEATQGLNKVVPMGHANKYDELQTTQYSDEELLKLETLIQSQLDNQNLYRSQVERPLQSLHTNIQLSSMMVPETVITPKPVAYSPVYEQRLIPQPVTQLRAVPIQSTIPRPTFKYVMPKPRRPDPFTILKESFMKMFNLDKEVPRAPKIPSFHTFPHDHRLNTFAPQSGYEVVDDNKRYKLVPYEFVTEKPTYESEKWVDWNRYQTELLKTPKYSSEVTNRLNKLEQEKIEFPKYLSALKYAPQFENHKIEVDFQKQSEQVEQDNTIEKEEGSDTKTGSVPNQTTVQNFFEPEPAKPVNVELTHPSTMPLQIESQSLSLTGPRLVEINPVQYEVGERIQVPGMKDVFFKVDHYIPEEEKKEFPETGTQENPDKFTVFRHVW